MKYDLTCKITCEMVLILITTGDMKHDTDKGAQIDTYIMAHDKFNK